MHSVIIEKTTQVPANFLLAPAEYSDPPILHFCTITIRPHEGTLNSKEKTPPLSKAQNTSVENQVVCLASQHL